ncbi:MAG TPA: hypothetical protein PKE45_08535 [Caldilineaceae bacterium]|nr:hypothetical protein [Caldilineaceae bacterium]
MTKQWVLVALLVCILTLAGVPSRVGAAVPLRPQARATPVTLFRLSGRLATADFAALVDGCVYNEALVFVGALTSQDAPGAPTATQRVSVLLSSRNLCTGEWPIYATGSTPLPTDGSPIDPQLTTAQVETPVVVTDSDTGASYALALDLSWTGTGERSRSQSHTHAHAPGCTTTFRHADIYRLAAVSGNLGNAAISFTASDLIFAQLHSLTSATIEVGCGGS